MKEDENSDMPNVEREGWNIEKLDQESVNEQSDDILRKTLRGNEDKGNPDKRDIVGSALSNETPQGREEGKNAAKNDIDENK